MNDAAYHKKLSRVLERMGGVYNFNDLMERIVDGRMQSFSHDNSWLVTEINSYPRTKTLDFVVGVGDLKDWRVLHDRAIAFADEMSIPIIRAYGRRGWIPCIKEKGWRPVTTNMVYIKEL